MVTESTRNFKSNMHESVDIFREQNKLQMLDQFRVTKIYIIKRTTDSPIFQT